MNPKTTHGPELGSLSLQKIGRLTIALLLLVTLGGFARAATQVVVDLNGATFSHGVSFTRTSGGTTLDAFSRYAYQVAGTVHGTGTLGFVIPNNTNIASFLDRIQPGSSSHLTGFIDNPGGVLPFTFLDRHYEGTINTGAGTIFAALDVLGTVDAAGMVSFSVSNVTVTFNGSPMSDSVVFEPGSTAAIGTAPQAAFANAGFTGLGGGASYGFIHFTTMTSGKVTGFLFSDGRKYPFNGRFDDGGSFTKTFKRRVSPGATPESVALNLRLATDGNSFEGEFGADLFSGERDKRGTKSEPVSEMGTFNAVLGAADLTPGGGPVRGFLSLKVRPTGAATFLGALPDGTVVKGATQVSITGDLPVAVGLYKGKAGFLAGGTVIAQADLLRWTGLLQWTKPAGSPGLYGEAGLADIPTSLAGVPYGKPAANTRVLSDLTASNGAATATVSPGFSKSISVDEKNKVTVTTPGPDKFSITIAAKTGLFTGSFLDGTTRRKLRGIFIQDATGAQFGDGFFLGTDAAGRVLIDPN